MVPIVCVCVVVRVMCVVTGIMMYYNTNITRAARYLTVYTNQKMSAVRNSMNTKEALCHCRQYTQSECASANTVHALLGAAARHHAVGFGRVQSVWVGFGQFEFISLPGKPCGYNKPIHQIRFEENSNNATT